MIMLFTASTFEALEGKFLIITPVTMAASIKLSVSFVESAVGHFKTSGGKGAILKHVLWLSAAATATQ